MSKIMIVHWELHGLRNSHVSSLIVTPPQPVSKAHKHTPLGRLIIARSPIYFFLPTALASSLSTFCRLEMAVQSTLRPTKQHLAQLAKLYASHRPLIQQFLNVAFVLYVLSTTYRSVSARPTAKSSSKGKEKAREESPLSAKKPPRVAVRLASSRTITIKLSMTICLDVG